MTATEQLRHNTANSLLKEWVQERDNLSDMSELVELDEETCAYLGSEKTSRFASEIKLKPSTRIGIQLEKLVELKQALMSTIDSVAYYGGFSSKAAKTVQELKNMHYKICEIEESST